MAGGGGDGPGGAEGCGGAEDRADVAGVLHPGQDDDQRRAIAVRNDEEIFELRGARDDECGDALGVLGVGDAFEEVVGGGEDREGHFRAGDEMSELVAMAFAGFAEEDGFDFAAGRESFFDEPDAFDADGTGFGGESAAKSHAEELEPAIVAGSKKGRRFRGRGHLLGRVAEGEEGKEVEEMERQAPSAVSR